MPKGNVSDCIHSKTAPTPQDPSLYICLNCSSLLIQSQNSSGEITVISTKKPKIFSSQLEIFPSFLSSCINNSIFFTQNKNIFQNKPDYLKYRSDCVRKLKIICNNLSLSKQTYFLALDYFDRICSKIRIFIKENLEEIIFFCVILASKFYENITKNNEIKRKINNYYMKKDILSDEMYILSVLNYEMNPLTVFDFIKDILTVGFVFEGENYDNNEKKFNGIYFLVEKMVYLFTENNLFIEMTPYQVAIGVIAVARKLLNLEPFSEIFKRVFIHSNNNNNRNRINYYVNNSKGNFNNNNSKNYNIESNNNSSSNNSISNSESSNEEDSETDSTEITNNNINNESKIHKEKNHITINNNNNTNNRNENSFENTDSNLDYESFYFSSFSRINRCFKFEVTPPQKK